MTSYRIPPFALLASALAILSACGGHHDAPAPDAVSFASRFNTGLATLGTGGGIAASAVASVFDEKYLDMGFGKADLLAALSATSEAAGTNPDLSLFPMAQVTNATLTGCDGDVCTLNATLTNADADTTSVDFSTKVKVIGDVVYLYGDQSATASI